MTRLLVLLAAVMLAGVINGLIFGDIIEKGEPAVKTEYRQGTFRRLKGRDAMKALIARQRYRLLILRCACLAVLVILYLVFREVSFSSGFLDCIQAGACAVWPRCIGTNGFEVVETETELLIRYPEGTELRLDKREQCHSQFIDVEIVRLLKLRDDDGRKVFTQEEVGRLFNLSRQMINRRARVMKETGNLISLLSNEHEKKVLTDKVIQRITEIVCEDWWKKDEDVAAQLVAEKLVEKISPGTVNIALSHMDVRMFRMAVRKQIRKGDFENRPASRQYLVRRLFSLLEETISAGSHRQEEYIDLKLLNGKINESVAGNRGEYRKNVEQHRQSTDQNKKRKRNILRAAIELGWDIFKQRKPVCPDCMCGEVKLKECRERTYKSRGNQFLETKAIRYNCCNPDCGTKTFTLLPNELGRWAQADFFLKRNCLNLIFHVRGSYRRVSDHITFDSGVKGPSWTTILNWVRKAGREAVELEKIMPVRSSGYIGLDEKWVKLKSEWIYIYEVVDIRTRQSIFKRVFPECNKDNSKAVLLELKARGYLPKVLVTDCTKNYDGPVKQFFPDADHQKCLFHAEKDAKTLIRKYLGDESQREVKKQLEFLVRELFAARKTVDIETLLQQMAWAKNYFPKEAGPLFDMIERTGPHLIRAGKSPEIPRTNNAVESAIKEFDLLYSTTYGFSSIVALQEFLDAYNVYLQFRKYTDGPFKGKCPLEIAGHDITGLSWDFWLLAA
jgi:transposase-like protein